MRIELGARVTTRDGQDAGTIDRLIFDPVHGVVKAAVLRKGTLLTRDVEAPLEALEARSKDEVVLTYTAEELAALPNFDEARYVEPPLEYAPQSGYPATGLYWPTAYGRPDHPPVTGDRFDEAATEAYYKEQLANAVVGEGSQVMRTRDEEMIGTVHRLDFDPESGELIRVVVRRGGLFNADEIEIPAGEVAGIDDGIIYVVTVPGEGNLQDA